jgi:glycine cleavage system H lipoate-binding protein
MPTHDLTTLYSAKAVEYLIAVSYLVLFIPFWRFVNGGQTARVRVAARSAVPARLLQDLFDMPARLFFHPGHAWARVDGADTVTIGIDDFARKLVGPLSAINLPQPGDTVMQGDKGWALVAGDTEIAMLSPVDGTVIAANDAARSAPQLVHQDPYDRGWLLRVRSPRLASNLKHLLAGDLARSWMNGVADALRLEAGPELGLVYEDGGVPVDGLARGLDSGRWAAIARQFFLTEDGGSHA